MEKQQDFHFAVDLSFSKPKLPSCFKEEKPSYQSLKLIRQELHLLRKPLLTLEIKPIQ